MSTRGQTFNTTVQMATRINPSDPSARHAKKQYEDAKDIKHEAKSRNFKDRIGSGIGGSHGSSNKTKAPVNIFQSAVQQASESAQSHLSSTSKRKTSASLRVYPSTHHPTPSSSTEKPFDLRSKPSSFSTQPPKSYPNFQVDERERRRLANENAGAASARQIHNNHQSLPLMSNEFEVHNRQQSKVLSIKGAQLRREASSSVQEHVGETVVVKSLVVKGSNAAGSKGKEKEKATEPMVVEISDDEEDDPIQDPDGHDPPRPSNRPSSSKLQDGVAVDGHPPSDDPLLLKGSDKEQPFRSGERAMGRVATAVQEINAKTDSGRPSVPATAKGLIRSMQPKQFPTKAKRHPGDGDSDNELAPLRQRPSSKKHSRDGSASSTTYSMTPRELNFSFPLKAVAFGSEVKESNLERDGPHFSLCWIHYNHEAPNKDLIIITKALTENDERYVTPIECQLTDVKHVQFVRKLPNDNKETCPEPVIILTFLYGRNEELNKALQRRDPAFKSRTSTTRMFCVFKSKSGSSWSREDVDRLEEFKKHLDSLKMPHLEVDEMSVNQQSEILGHFSAVLKHGASETEQGTSRSKSTTQPKLSFIKANAIETESRESLQSPTRKTRRSDAAAATVSTGSIRRSNRNSTSTNGTNLNDIEIDTTPSDKLVLVWPHQGAGSISVTHGDTLRLKDEEFLNDTLIELGLKRILEALKNDEQKAAIAANVHIFNSFFYKKVSAKRPPKETKDWNPHSTVRKWTQKFDLFSKKYVIVPINEHLHWYLSIIINPAAILAPPASVPSERSRQTRSSLTHQTFDLDGEPASGSNIPQLDGDLEDMEETELQGQLQDAIARTQTGGETEGEAEGDMDISDNERSPHEGLVESSRDPKNSSGPAAGELLQKMERLDVSTKPSNNTMLASPSDSLSKIAFDYCSEDESGSAALSSSKPAEALRSRSLTPSQALDLTSSNSSPAENNNLDNPPTMLQRVVGANTDSDKSKLDPFKCYIFTFDSLGGSHKPVRKHLLNYLVAEAADKKGLRETSADENIVFGQAQVPLQNNFSDCGLYLLHYVDEFLGDPITLSNFILDHLVTKSTSNTSTKDPKDETNSETEVSSTWKNEVAKGRRQMMRNEVKKLCEEWQKYREPILEEEKKRKEEKKKRKREDLAAEKETTTDAESRDTTSQQEEADSSRKRKRPNSDHHSNIADLMVGRKDSDHLPADPPPVTKDEPKAKSKGAGKKGRAAKTTEILDFTADSDDDDEGTSDVSPPATAPANSDAPALPPSLHPSSRSAKPPTSATEGDTPPRSPSSPDQDKTRPSSVDLTADSSPAVAPPQGTVRSRDQLEKTSDEALPPPKRTRPQKAFVQIDPKKNHQYSPARADGSSTGRPSTPALFSGILKDKAHLKAGNTSVSDHTPEEDGDLSDGTDYVVLPTVPGRSNGKQRSDGQPKETKFDWSREDSSRGNTSPRKELNGTSRVDKESELPKAEKRKKGKKDTGPHEEIVLEDD
ncbi:cysteine proteinase [Meredithblackwellia eburnea MCA 4105]